MKVSLRKGEKTSGLIRKTTEYCLYVKVELTDEEKGAIKKAGIEKFVIMEYSLKGLELNYLVKSVVYLSDQGKETVFVAANAIHRNEMEQTIKEKLTALKSQITAQLSSGSGTESFEL